MSGDVSVIRGMIAWMGTRSDVPSALAPRGGRSADSPANKSSAPYLAHGKAMLPLDARWFV